MRAQGLLFYGNKTPVASHRTSYIVFNKKAPTFSKYIDIAFDVKMPRDKTFGYILHLIDDKTNRAYSLTYGYIGDEVSVFKFNTEGIENHITIDCPKVYVQKWISVKLHIDFLSGEETLCIGKYVKKSNKRFRLPANVPFKIGFGRRDNLIDVPAFAIRNLKISSEETTYRFPLNESKGEKVHDEKGHTVGGVAYPYWIINDSYYWKKRASFDTPSCIGSKFNDKRQEIELFTPKHLLVYKADTKKLLTLNYATPMPDSMLLGTSFLDEQADRLYAYEINHLPTGHNTICYLDLNTMTWKIVGKGHSPIQLHHHVGIWDARRSRYITFGGFGSEQYSKKFLTYNQKTDQWDTLQFKGDKITPRFYSSIASTKDGNYLYVYGGVGNESGDQNIGHVYYNDLYGIDLIHHTIKKLWEHPLKENRVPSEKMVLSRDGKSLYVIRYAEYIKASSLKLYKIRIQDGAMEQLGDSIPFASGSIKSTVSLYGNFQLNEFYCVAHEFNEQTGTVHTNIYSLLSPPVSKESLNGALTKSKKRTLLIFIALVLCLLPTYFYYKNEKRKKQKPEEPAAAPAAEEVPRQKPVPDAPAEAESALVKKERINSIYLYGIFAIFDRNGHDITYLLGKKLKLIFCYILLNSTEKRNGVSSNVLNEVFWPDKTDNKARNIKGVSINNLRKILSELDGIKLVYDKGSFKIEIDESLCYCDYLHLQNLLKEPSQPIEAYLSIWEKGRILEDVEDPLFDKYKQESEETVFSVTPKYIKASYESSDYQQVIRICQVVLARDPLNEEVFFYCLYAYKKLNEFENVLKVYATFTLEYRKSMGEDYQKTLEEILKKM